MSKTKKTQQIHTPAAGRDDKSRDVFARVTGVLGISIAALSLWQSHSTSEFTYKSTVPALSFQVQMREPMQMGRPLAFGATAKNYGTTAAKHTQYVGIAFTLLLGQKPTFDEALAKDNYRLGPDILPGQTHNLTTDVDLRLKGSDADRYTEILAGHFNLFVMHKFTFNDIRGQQHTQYFCSQFDARTKGFIFCPDFEQ